MLEVALRRLRHPQRGKGGQFPSADLEPDLALTAWVPVVGVGWIDAPRQTVLRLVVAIAGNVELDAVKRMLACLHHVEDHVFVIVLFDACEIQIGRKASPASDEHLAKTGATLEGELVQNTALCHQLEQVSEHDLVFGDHDVAQP